MFSFEFCRKQLSGCHLSSELWESRVGPGGEAVRVWSAPPSVCELSPAESQPLPPESLAGLWSLICPNVEAVNLPLRNMGFKMGQVFLPPTG